MSPAYKKNGIPDRWLDYQAVGKRLQGTRFIAFKVPLKPALNNRLPDSDVFGPWELLDTMTEENQELGLIIDLTFTTRYYKVQDIPKSLLCVKIFTAGHEIPSDATILSFKRAVHSFLRDNADNDKLIGVHCTHGLNRTGYLICRYLIDVDEMDPEEAIELFNASRGHAIERQNYLEDLQSGPKRSNEGIEKTELEPVRGCATQRPVYSEVSSCNMEERPTLSHEPSQYRSFPLRVMNHRSHPPPPGNSYYPHGAALLLSPPFPPFPTYRPPIGAPYHWTPPQPDDWQRPYPRHESRFTPPQFEWRPMPPYALEDRRQSPSPPTFPFHQDPPLPAVWTSGSDTNTDNIPREWDGPKMRSHYRSNQRVKHPYNYPS